MKIAHFFIDRPIFAAVISVVTVILGGIAYMVLPAAQYPDIVPPTIVVRASYPGASPEVIADTVAQLFAPTAGLDGVATRSDGAGKLA